MAKGKTNQPLLIVVDWQWRNHAEIQKLEAAGHRIQSFGEQTPTDDKPDLILHPTAHGWNDMMWAYLPAALTAARARKRRARA